MRGLVPEVARLTHFLSCGKREILDGARVKSLEFGSVFGSLRVKFVNFSWFALDGLEVCIAQMRSYLSAGGSSSAGFLL